MEVSQDFQGHSDHVVRCGFQSRWKDHCIWLMHDNTLKLWSVSSGECLKTFQGQNHWSKQCGFQSRWKDCCIWLETTILWNCGLFPGGECLKTFQGHSRLCKECSIQSRWKDRCIWLVGHDFETVVCFLVESVSRLSRAIRAMYDSVAFSPDGRTVVSGSFDRDFETVVCFWWRVSQDFPGPQQLCMGLCGFQSRWKDRCIWLGRQYFETVVCFSVESVSRLSRATATG